MRQVNNEGGVLLITVVVQAWPTCPSQALAPALAKACGVWRGASALLQFLVMIAKMLSKMMCRSNKMSIHRAVSFVKVGSENFR
jgi:hypothetical protein